MRLRRLLTSALLTLTASVAFAQTPSTIPGRVPFSVPSAVPMQEGARPLFGVDLDGDDYLTMSNAESAGAFDFGLNSFTIQLWFKVTTTPAGMYFFQSRDGGNDWRVTLQIRDIDTISLFLDDRAAPGGPGHGFSFTDYDAAIPENTWIHVAGVVDRVADEAYLYVGGVLRATTDITGLLTMTTGDAEYLLGTNAGSGSFLTGKMTAVGVHKGTAVSDFSDRFTPFSTANSRTAAWAFKPGSGTLVTPYVGAARWSFGTLTNAPGWTISGFRLPPVRF